MESKELEAKRLELISNQDFVKAAAQLIENFSKCAWQDAAEVLNESPWKLEELANFVVSLHTAEVERATNEAITITCEMAVNCAFMDIKSATALLEAAGIQPKKENRP